MGLDLNSPRLDESCLICKAFRPNSHFVIQFKKRRIGVICATHTIKDILLDEYLEFDVIIHLIGQR